MILKKMHLRNFKCVKDSGEFNIDEKVTCLVGKNESGKTALLQGLNKLNPVIEEDSKFDDLDYPAMAWTDYKARREAEPAEALSTTWELEREDEEELSGLFGDSIDYSAPVRVEKGYSNVRSWDIPVDEAKLVQHLLTKHGLLKSERSAIGSPKSLADLLGSLKRVAEPSARQTELATFVQSEFPKGDGGAKAREMLASRLPRVVYFSEYLRLPGVVSISDLKVRESKSDANRPLRGQDRVFLAYLSLIGATAASLEATKEFERLTRELEGASNHLTATMKKYWSQNRHLRVNCRFDAALSGDLAPFNSGYVARTRIENTRHGVTTSFDERSAGFVWFFSFLVWFSQVKKQYGENVVILLDEPGLTLHAKAQNDLLRYIEHELAPTYQVIYTTHSPFLVDSENLMRVRTVEDVVIPADATRPGDAEQDLGTKVGSDILSVDRDTVFPLQACLGYEITQSLFVGPHSLLVEGPSDLLYLIWFRRRLSQLGRATLDRRWTVTPSGGIDKVAAFVSLFGGNKLHVAVLTDFARGDKTKVENLRRSKLLADGHVLTADTYAEKPEADVEDLIGDDAYLDLANRALGLPTTQMLKAPAEVVRIVKWVEKQAALLPPDAANFDHYIPAAFLMEQGANGGISPEAAALDRFERLFVDLNNLLPGK